MAKKLTKKQQEVMNRISERQFRRFQHFRNTHREMTMLDPRVSALLDISKSTQDYIVNNYMTLEKIYGEYNG